jgi:hypothetical protein
MALTKLILCLLFSLTVLSSCTDYDYTLKPEFKVTLATVDQEIHKTINVEIVEINGLKIPYADTFDHFIGIRLINPIPIPSDSASAALLLRKVAVKAKSLLVNQSQYNSYHVYFIEKDTTRFLFIPFTYEGVLFHNEFNKDDF